MISFNDAARFSEESKAVKTFKPWWDVVLDYLLVGLLLIALLSWTRVISTDSSGLICVPRDKTVSYGFVFAKYFNAKCTQESEARLLLYYPYFLFLQWLVLFLLQTSWLKIPAVKNRFDCYYYLFTQLMCAEKPYHHYHSSYDVLDAIDDEYGTVNSEALRSARNKVMLLLREKSILIWIYLAKVVSLFVFSLVFFCLMVYWVMTLNFKQVDFDCKFNIKANVITNNLICNFSPAFFLYGVILANLGFLVFLFFISFYATYWMSSGRHLLNLPDKKNMPGVMDIQFCVDLITSNLKNGQDIQLLLRDMLAQEFNSCTGLPHETSAGVFNKELDIVRWIMHHIGLQEISMNKSSSRLNDVIEQVRKSLPEFKSRESSNMVAKIVNQISQHPSEYMKTQENDKYECQYILQATSKILNIKIVLITSEQNIQQVYLPRVPLFDVENRTKFLVFVKPEYFSATELSNPEEDEGLGTKCRRLFYSSNVSYREKLLQAAIEHFKQNRYNKRSKRVDTEETKLISPSNEDDDGDDDDNNILFQHSDENKTLSFLHDWEYVSSNNDLEDGLLTRL